MGGRIDPRQMKRVMKQMGIKTDDIDAFEVLIRTAEKDIVITNPEVIKTDVRGQIMFQISGEISERESEGSAAIEITEEDVQMVAEQTGVSREEAKKMLEKTKGDIAEAIMELKK